MEFQQGQNYVDVFRCAIATSFISLSWCVLYFVVLCTHLSWCDYRRHAVGGRCTHCYVLFTLTMLLQHILKQLGLSWYKFTLAMLSQHILEKFELSCYRFTFTLPHLSQDVGQISNY